MKIRTATRDDLKAITQVEAHCFPRSEAATEEDFRKRLSVYSDHFWIMQKENGQIVSFINGLAADEADLQDEMYHDASFHQPEGQWQMIFGLNTLPEYREQGYAGRLIEHVIQVSREAGRRGLVLTCKENLLNYYAKFGFINEGISDSTHGEAEWYQMRLTF